MICVFSPLTLIDLSQLFICTEWYLSLEHGITNNLSFRIKKIKI